MTTTRMHDAVLGADGVLEQFLGDMVVDDYDMPPKPPSYGEAWAGRLAALAVMAAIGIVIVAAVVSARAGDAERVQTTEALTARIEAVSEAVSVQTEQIDATALEVEQLRRGLLDSAAAQIGTDRLGALGAQAATTDLSGPGLVVTIDDAPDAAAGSLNRVLDRDLQDIVNTLWRMGASGVDVNGQRLTGVTAIRGAGEAILVNYQPLTRPYLVSAVGARTVDGQDAGLSDLLGRLTADYGLVTDLRTGDVALPGGELRAPRFVRTVLEGAAS